jgi:hypothetical protein
MWSKALEDNLEEPVCSIFAWKEKDSLKSFNRDDDLVGRQRLFIHTHYGRKGCAQGDVD